jgi:DNA repair protein RecN (Recombination protein N)
MLTHLQLRDLVIVDKAELDFGPGLTALTGETGAGKSIVVDALLLVGGGRAGGDVVRQGAERAEIAASFTGLPDGAKSWLEAQAIEFDDEVIVRRVIGADGRSRAYVNGQLVPIQLLRELAEFLIDIHGQQEFQHLVKRSAQRDMLDEHMDASALLAAVAAASAAARACRREYESLKAAADNREARLDLLRYQLTELKAEVTSVEAIEELFVEQKRISGRGRLSNAARTALTAISDADADADTDSANDLLAKAQVALRGAGDADPELIAAGKLLAEATILTHEAAESLRRYLENLDVDPARQEEIERHAAALEALARKHRQTVLELPAQLVRTEQELQSLENAELSLAELQRQLAALTLEYAAAAQRLTQARTAAAQELGTQISRLMQTLGMAGGRFAVSLTPADGEFAAHGMDDIEFLVSANPGQALKGLAKVASGGELSRISLAVQVAAAAKASSLCMVFDEVDSGIGGAIAEIVGRQLRELGVRSQVLCVTHLPQVAAQAHSQFQVIKQTDGKVTRTAVKTLDAAERVDEIARMLGGVDITAQARAHAREMLSVSDRAAPTPAAAKPATREKPVVTTEPAAARAPAAAKTPPATAPVPGTPKVAAAPKAAAPKAPAAAKAAVVKKKRARS